MSPRTEKTLGGLNPKARAVFERMLEQVPALLPPGVRVEAISGTRTAAEQNALFAKGRTAPGKVVTYARAGQSWHNYGVAIDLGLFRGTQYLDAASPGECEKIYQRIAESIAKPMGIEWGGDWKRRDTPHFQWTTGLGGGSSPGTVARAKYAEAKGDVAKLV